jgi:Flp pilus assembly protein TadD
VPGGPILLFVGAAAILLSMATGFVRSFVVYHRPPRLGVEYTTEMNELVRENGYAAALPYIRSAALIDFDDHAAVTALLESARQAGNAESAIGALFALVRMKPDDAALRNELVAALLGEGRAAEALAHAQLAVQLSPDSANAHCNLGAALLGLEQKRESAAAYRRALELDPDSQAARLALEFPLRGF